jgi:hypothetical protein
MNCISDSVFENRIVKSGGDNQRPETVPKIQLLGSFTVSGQLKAKRPMWPGTDSLVAGPSLVISRLASVSQRRAAQLQGALRGCDPAQSLSGPIEGLAGAGS